MIDELPFASPFVYATRGESEASRKSRQLRHRIKRGDEPLYEQIAVHIRTLIERGDFPAWFGPEAILVPVPGHAPLAPGARSNSERIARSLQHAGIAGRVELALIRHQLVRKSAWADPEDRPRAAEHCASLRVDAPLALTAGPIVLVDDVITRGATLLGAAQCILAAVPDARVRGLALLRAMTNGDIETIRQPCTGQIRCDARGECFREP